MGSSLTNLKSLATAQDWGHARIKSLASLLANKLIGLVVVLTTLGVANHHVAASKLGQHLRGDLTGECTIIVDRDVLCTVLDLKIISVNNGLHGTKIGERRDHQDLATRVVKVVIRKFHGQALNQVICLEVIEVHLPVTCHQRGTCHCSVLQYCDTGQNLTLEQFERGATTGGNVRESRFIKA